MNPILAIAGAHIRHEGKLALLPIAFGVVAVAVRASSGPSPAAGALGVAAVFVLPGVVAALLGLNLLAPDLRQRRLSFFLSRPCALWQLWCGRLLASLAILTVASLGYLPAVFGSWSLLSAAQAALAFPLLLVSLVLVVNALSCILLSYAWDAFLFDLAAIALLLAAASRLFRPLLDLFANPIIVPGALMAVLGWAIVATIPAGLAFLWGGRGRAKWGHRWFSWTFWPVVGLSLVGVNVWRILETRTPLDSVLRRYAIGRPLNDERFLVNVWGRGAFPRWFAVNPKTGATERVTGWSHSRVASADGDFTGWIRISDPRSRSFEFSLEVARTSALGKPLHEVSAPTDRFADLSAGGRLALFRVGGRLGGGLRVMDVSTGNVLGEIPAPEGADVRRARFVDDHAVEVMIWEATAFRKVRFSFTGIVQEERRFDRPTGARMVEHEPTGRYAIAEKSGIVLYDREGKRIGALNEPGPVGFFTRSGILVAQTRDTLAVLSDDGKPPRVISLPGVRLEIFGELDSGEVIVSFDGGTALIDPTVAAIVQTFEGVGPLRNMRRDFKEVAAEYNLSTVGSDTFLRAFQNDDGDLLYLDRGARKLRLLVKSTLGDF